MGGNLYLINANIWTGDPTRPHASSIVIRDGVIDSLDTPITDFEPIDCNGAWVGPGLIDSHMHFVAGGLGLGQLDLSDVTSRSMFEDRIARAHADLGSDQWLIAHGWQESLWGGEQPDKLWLQACVDRPAVCYRVDLHAVLVNDAVLARIDDLSDPPGGHVVRHENSGEATGRLLEAAAWKLVNPIVPKPSDLEHRRACEAAVSHCHALGLTTVASMEYWHKVEQFLFPLRKQQRIRFLLTILDDRCWPMTFMHGDGLQPDQWMKIIGYKAFLDGTLGSRTARMLEPYADDPTESGMFVELGAEGKLATWMQAVADDGFSPSMHAIGDAAVRMALDAIDTLDDTQLATRPRIEHVQHIAPSDIPRMKGRIASMQPLHRADDAPVALQRVGKNRMQSFLALASLRDAGADLAFGSDWPVVSCDPMLGMHAAITGAARDGSLACPDQTLTPEEALCAYTCGAAEALGSPDRGVLRAGALGDLVVLDRHPLKHNWIENGWEDTPSVQRTIVGGNVVFDAAAEGNH